MLFVRFRARTLLPLAGALTLGACDTMAPPTAEFVIEDSADAAPLDQPLGADFTLGPVNMLTSSNQDVWPELEGDWVAWYRQSPLEEQGLWLMDLTTRQAERIWEGVLLSEFDLHDGEVFWGSADGLHTFDIASRNLETLDATYRQYRDVNAGPRYVLGTANQSSDRPFVFDRATGVIETIPTPTSVPATRGDGTHFLWADGRVSFRKRDLFAMNAGDRIEMVVTDQDQVLNSSNAAISGNRVVYFDARFCPGSLQLHDLTTGETTPILLPDVTCPIVVGMDGDVVIYRHNASGNRIFLGFYDVSNGDLDEVELTNPGNWRIDADLDGNRVVHTSVDGLQIMDLRFQPAQPPVANAGGPYQVDEGSSLTLDGSASFSMNDAPLSYLWDLGDGAQMEGSASPEYTWVDNGEFTVSLTVSEEESGLSDTAETTVRVMNVAPVVSGPARLEAQEGVEVEYATAFEDAGVADGPWSWRILHGDIETKNGVAEEPGALPSKVWAPGDWEVGEVTLTVEVTDKDGATGTLQTVVAVAPAEDDEERKPEVQEIRVKAGHGRNNRVRAWRGRGLVPIVVYGSEEAPIGQMKRREFRLGPDQAKPVRFFGRTAIRRDVDRDGKKDLLMWFRLGATGLERDAQEVCLTGMTKDGQALEGCSPIRIRGR